MWFFLFAFNSFFIVALVLFLRAHSLSLLEQQRKNRESFILDYKPGYMNAIHNVTRDATDTFVFVTILFIASLLYSSLLYLMVDWLLKTNG